MTLRASAFLRSICDVNMFAKPNGGAREVAARTAVCKVPAMFVRRRVPASTRYLVAASNNSST
jgi:hypothetical protein